MSDETLSKYELTLIDKIVGVLGISDFRNALWSKDAQKGIEKKLEQLYGE